MSLEGIPAALKGVPQITLTLQVDQDVIVQGEAVETRTGIKASIDRNSTGLTEEKIKELLQEAEINKAKDEEELRSKEKDNKIENIIQRAESILSNKDKPWTHNSQQIERALAKLGLAIQDQRSDEIRLRADELQTLLNSPPPFDDIFSEFFGFPGGKQSSSTSAHHPTTSGQARPEVSGQLSNAGSPSVGPRLHPLGKIFGGQDFTPDPNLCFILMPFRTELDPVYEDHVKPLVESEGILCQRADEIVGTDLITYDIWEKINRARFLIADLTGKNPNVFYEVGLAHAISKEVILITQSIDDVPFDLKALRTVVYSFTPRGMKVMEKKLLDTIRSIMRSS